MKPLRIGIIGLGAIGTRLIEVLTQEFRGAARVDFLCDLKQERIHFVQEKWLPKAPALSWRALVDRSDLVIEAASQEIALPVARRALQKNKQVMILSVGGLLSWKGLSLILGKTRGRLWIPSGALAGVDALLAAHEGEIRQVTLTTRKPLAGLEDAPSLQEKKIRLSQIKKPTLVFEGSAHEAVRAFPQNVNVAATLALAGLGAEKTRVEIWTSPTYRRNEHEVEAEGDFGRIHTVVENLPSRANPKTSELAVLSAAATLKKIFSRVHLGT